MAETQVDPAHAERVEAFRVFCRPDSDALTLYYDVYDRLPEGMFRDELWDARGNRSDLRYVGAEYHLLDDPALPDWCREDDEPVDPSDVVASEPEHRRDR